MKQIKFLILFIFFLNKILAQDSLNLKTSDSTSLSFIEVKYKAAILGAVTEIETDDFNKGAIFSPMQLIQGKVPGLAIMRTLGNDPNQDLQIQLRGTSSLFLSSKPLYLINGTVVENPNIIIPEDIESIKVLKSISETAPYGIRGSNGIILINTKKGKSGKKLSVSYSSYWYIENISRKSDFLSASEWRQLRQDWALKTGAPSGWSSNYSALSNEIIDYGYSTDWLKEITQNKLSQAHNLSFSGNIKKTAYYAALNYKNMNGVIKRNGNETYNGFVSVSKLLLKDKLRIDFSLISTNTNYSQYNTNPFLSYENVNIVSRAEYFNPSIPTVPGNYVSPNYPYPDYNTNPVTRLNNTVDERSRDNLLVNFQVDFEILKGLIFTAGYATNSLKEKYDFLNDNQRDSVNIDKYFRNMISNRIEKTTSAGLHFNKNMKLHQINISVKGNKFLSSVNYERRDSSTWLNEWSKSGASYEMPLFYTSFSAYFGYNYAKKYFLNANLSDETTNTYKHDNTSLYYPSISVMWQMSNEDFLKNVIFVNNLKLRASYGKSHRELPVPVSPMDPGYISSDQVFSSPGLHGEKITESNIGIDLSILSKIMISFECFSRYTYDGIIEWSAMVPTLNQTFISNDTKIRSRGWELLLNALPVKTDDFKWNINFNIAKTNSYLLFKDHLSKPDVGDAIGSIYGFRFAGFAENGRELSYDENGKIAISTYDYRPVIGNVLPKSYLGLTNNFVYKSFDFGFSLRGAMGFNINNLNRSETIRYNRLSNIHSNFSDEIRTIDPMAIGNLNLMSSDYFLEKGDFVKIDNISLGYNLNPKLKYITSVRFYIVCNNVHTFTRFTGWDPEMAGITGKSAGVYSFNSYPVTRIFVFGVKLNI